MSLARNLAAGSQSVTQTKKQLKLGAQNKLGDVLSSFGGSFLCVPAIRSVHIAGEDANELASIRAMAAKAESAGCGNCGEHAAVAFIHLLDRKILPLDYMAATNVDHAFVVIGRAAGSDETDPGTWGPDAVVVDAWHDAGKVYPATEFRRRMYKGLRMAPYSEYRVNEPSAPPPPAATTARYHEVKSGDSLSSLAGAYYHDLLVWPIIYDANQPLIGHNPNVIRPGQRLMIPGLESRSSVELAQVRQRGRRWRTGG